MVLQLFLQYYTLFNLTDFINLLYFPYLDKALGFKRTLSCFQQQPLMLLLSTHTSFSVLSELFLSKGETFILCLQCSIHATCNFQFPFNKLARATSPFPHAS